MYNKYINYKKVMNFPKRNSSPETETYKSLIDE